MSPNIFRTQLRSHSAPIPHPCVSGMEWKGREWIGERTKSNTYVTHQGPTSSRSDWTWRAAR